MWDLGRRADISISLEFGKKEKYTIKLENLLIADTTALGVKGGLHNDAVQEVQPGAGKDLQARTPGLTHLALQNKG